MSSPPAGEVLERYVDLTGTARGREIRGRAVEEVALNFYGLPVSLHVNSAREATQWRYFFKYFLADAPAPHPDYRIWLGLDGDDGSFIESIHRKDNATKYLCIETGGIFALWSRFSHWSGAPSPLPPFNFTPLNRRLLQFSASAVGIGGRAILFLAPPYQGKSTLANAWIARGASPLADNVAVYDASAALVVPYLTPTGIREETVGRLDGLGRAVAGLGEDRITVSEVTGRVYLLHFDEIMRFDEPAPAPCGLCVYPVNRRGELGSRVHARALTAAEHGERLAAFAIDNGMPAATRAAALDRLARGVPGVEIEYDLLHADLDALLATLADHAGLA